MPQLDKFTLIAEYFWLTSCLIFIYVLSSFYILPLLLRNIIARRAFIRSLERFIKLPETVLFRFTLEENMAAGLLTKNSMMYFPRKTMGRGISISLTMFRLLCAFLLRRKIFSVCYGNINTIVFAVKISLFLYGFCLLSFRRYIDSLNFFTSK